MLFWLLESFFHLGKMVGMKLIVPATVVIVLVGSLLGGRVYALTPVDCGSTIDPSNGWFQISQSVCDTSNPSNVHDLWGCQDQKENFTSLYTPDKPDIAHVCSSTTASSTVSGPGPAGLPQLQDLIRRLINLTVPLAFIVLTVVLVWGGIKFLTSGGEQNSLKSARDLMTWALLGILFLALAWIILLLIQAFTGVDVTHFCLKFDQGC